jgi:hypothetical protein
MVKKAASEILRACGAFALLARENVTDDSPVHQIFRLQDG